MMGLAWMSVSSSIWTRCLPCNSSSADGFDCVGAAVFGLRPRLGLQAVNVTEIKLFNGDCRRSLESRIA
jgi:hypothetical protein